MRSVFCGKPYAPAMNNGMDKQVCAVTKVETRSASSYSSQDGVYAAQDNILLPVDASSVSSYSSEGCSSYFSAGQESGNDSEIGAADPSQVVETVLSQPISSALQIRGSEVHVGPSLTYNGPVTINVTVQPQADHQTTPQHSGLQADSQPASQSQAQLQPQQQLQGEHQPNQQPVSQVQPQAEIEQPLQQQPVSQPQVQSQISQQQPPTQAQDQPPPDIQPPHRKEALRVKQPHSVLQRNLQTPYGQDFRGVKPSGCQLLAAQLTRKKVEAGDVGGAAVVPCWEQNLAIVWLTLIIVTVLGIAVTLVFIHSHSGLPTPDVSVTTSMANGTPPHLKHEGPKHEERQKRQHEHQNRNVKPTLGPRQPTLVTSTEIPPGIVSSGETERAVNATRTACKCTRPRSPLGLFRGILGVGNIYLTRVRPSG